VKHRKPVDPASLPYRPCVGMMVLNRRGLVWMGKRIVEEGSEIA
jgi:putative (di)nucleoside polyphosphate hydrolase